MDAQTGAARKIVFSSDQLPAELDDQARFSLWRDIYEAQYGTADVARLADRPFFARFEFVPYDAVVLAQFEGTMSRSRRTRQQVAADPRGDFMIGFNRSRSPMSLLQHGQEVVCDLGAAALFTNAETGELRTEIDNAWVSVLVPRQELIERVADAEDLIATPLDANRPAVRHLRSYIELLLASRGLEDDLALAGHVGTTLLDLAVLALGAKGDAGEMAQMRGLRASRAQEILSVIKAGFSNPAFSPHDVARKLGLSPRYIQKLLHETGQSFTERVLELRLQSARAMLASPRYDRLKVGEIAHRCGFNDTSHFNHRFRRRFGASPTQFRGGTGKDD